MHSRYFLFIISSLFVLIIFNSSYVFAADYYVDLIGGDDLDNGSIATPWKTILRAQGGDSRSPNVDPGDTVYIKGTRTYSTNVGLQFNADDSGTAGNYITYKVWSGETVVLSGTPDKTSRIFQLAGSDYLIFDGIEFTGSYPQPAGPRAIHFYEADNIIVQNCYLKDIYRGLSTSTTLDAVTNIQIINNTFDGVESPIYLNTGSGFKISGNTFKYTMEGIKLNPHNDPGQVVEDIDIYGNFFYQIGWGWKLPDGTSKPYASSAILVISQGGCCTVSNVNIYNNIFWGNANGIKTQRADTDIYNNTFYRQGYYDAFVLDNTVSGTGTGYAIAVDSGVNIDDIKNNIFYDNKNGDIYRCGGCYYNQSDNLFEDPDFVNGDPINIDPYNPNNYKLATNSPAIDQGADLSSAGIITDYFGGSRPSGTNHDIGAHEYGSVPNPAETATPNPPSNLQIITVN